MKNLYRVEMSEGTANDFYVVATDEGEASRSAQKTWDGWGYRTATVISVTVIAKGTQYPGGKIGWLIAEGVDL